MEDWGAAERVRSKWSPHSILGSKNLRQLQLPKAQNTHSLLPLYNTESSNAFPDNCPIWWTARCENEVSFTSELLSGCYTRAPARTVSSENALKNMGPNNNCQ